MSSVNLNPLNHQRPIVQSKSADHAAPKTEDGEFKVPKKFAHLLSQEAFTASVSSANRQATQIKPGVATEARLAMLERGEMSDKAFRDTGLDAMAAAISAGLRGLV